MHRRDWGLVALLLLITALSLWFAPPSSFDADAEAPPITVTAVADAAAASPTPTLPLTSTPTVAASVAATRTRTATAAPSPTPTLTPTQAPTPTATPFAFDTRPDLPRYIYIDQAVQYLYVFEHGQLVRAIPASCGLPDPDKYTPAWSGEVGQYWGTFFAFEVYADDAWYLYKSAGSILIHSLPYTLQNGYKVYQDRDALGVRPASHGCVRISPEDARWLTAWNPEGVPATVTDPYLEKWISTLSK